MASRYWIFGLLLSATALAGCAEGTFAKLDDRISQGTDSDCAIDRLFSFKAVCREPAPAATEAMYCYRTIGNVNCYGSPDLTVTDPKGVADAKSPPPRPKPTPKPPTT